MRAKRIMFVIACAGILGSCAATVPRELVNAREAYRRASTGIAAQVAPAELHVANQALLRAEQSFRKNADAYMTRDLAYVAQRRSEIAEVTAHIVIEQKNQEQARSDFRATQEDIVTETKLDLRQVRSALEASEINSEATANQLSVEQAARVAAERRTALAQATLARLAAVREEPRGMVITLSGSVLFASNQIALLPEARTRLDQVADVLLTSRERNLVIEGHTDSQGTDGSNIVLSQGRADAVRNYLVQRGYDADLIRSHGLGEGAPVSDNNTVEGRANNRRVEIIIERELHASSREE
jgi:outer membrane protein OmpA-like peptidoglycan-associated protein